VMIATYWMSYQRIVAASTSSAAEAADTGDPGLAAYHVMALIAPYLRGADRALIERLGADYLR
jgi:Bacterial transcriptional repressor